MAKRHRWPGPYITTYEWTAPNRAVFGAPVEASKWTGTTCWEYQELHRKPVSKSKRTRSRLSGKVK
jgi:hypothetical protein